MTKQRPNMAARDASDEIQLSIEGYTVVASKFTAKDKGISEDNTLGCKILQFPNDNGGTSVKRFTVYRGKDVSSVDAVTKAATRIISKIPKPVVPNTTQPVSVEYTIRHLDWKEAVNIKYSHGRNHFDGIDVYTIDSTDYVTIKQCADFYKPDILVSLVTDYQFHIFNIDDQPQVLYKLEDIYTALRDSVK